MVLAMRNAGEPEPHATDEYKRTSAYIQYTFFNESDSEMDCGPGNYEPDSESDSDSESVLR